MILQEQLHIMVDEELVQQIEIADNTEQIELRILDMVYEEVSNDLLRVEWLLYVIQQIEAME